MRLGARQTGFTIVELLIVIVIIGILAVIAIGAFSRAQDQARTATVQSDLKASAKQLEQAKADSGTYPATSAGLPASPNTSYQYAYNATADTFCLTGANGSSTYRVTSDNRTPVSGACPGHGVGGVPPITNLVTNPSLEANTSAGFGNNGAVASTYSTPSTTTAFGSRVYRRDFTGTATLSNVGPYVQIDTDPAQTNYMASVWIRVSKPMSYYIGAERRNSGGTNIGTLNSSNVALAANTWTRLTLSVPVIATMESFTFVIYSTSTSWAPGDWVEVDGLMVHEGTSLSAYADGNTSGWIWNGTTNLSTATGPAQ
ncbi:prepilin-type N-terminal cleavage/methylation domain-containing protein [Candidatus Saccharibacteria bacterium]|nr:prepilin-type N-terminal cleavage/methylation domain-containing protein [Candidatus Saccharibacteria bacterium]